MNPLNKAIDHAGGVTALAEKLGVRQSVVSNWRTRGDDPRAPAERCIAIEQATDGAVTRYELRPDVFGEAPPKPDGQGTKPSKQEAA
ncbi:MULTISPECIES: helix-turn-helix domain-containing protein [unclassified Rhodanobacter]|uniref:transcriptional regulator n=1 Tax=unclassified Rhodanobacter TaxID=2621553 RepID=UPI001BDE9F95|nr:MULTISPECIES: helix-turn-helix domain-containing protein [unclassified Rhodanobacter]MBT2142714.1 helix-turn-helix domain-containing protein [Rhodanobacter sp. LX-99]MBT2148213.1 helix-turn-helix domain-containing protein [Rhodanobacter sp. LX-100]